MAAIRPQRCDLRSQKDLSFLKCHHPHNQSLKLLLGTPLMKAQFYMKYLLIFAEAILTHLRHYHHQCLLQWPHLMQRSSNLTFLSNEVLSKKIVHALYTFFIEKSSRFNPSAQTFWGNTVSLYWDFLKTFLTKLFFTFCLMRPKVFAKWYFFNKFKPSMFYQLSYEIIQFLRNGKQCFYETLSYKHSRIFQ